MIVYSYPIRIHLADKRPNRGDTIDRLSPESTEQVAKRFHLDADYSGPLSPIGLAVDRSQYKQSKSILDCEEDLLLAQFLRNQNT